MHTYISEHMHQVVAGSGGNTMDLALLSTRINEEYIEVSVPLKHSTKALNTTSTTHGKSYRHTTHTEIVAANQLIIVQHPRATGIGWSTLSITTKCKHIYVPYYMWQRALFHVRYTASPDH